MTLHVCSATYGLAALEESTGSTRRLKTPWAQNLSRRLIWCGDWDSVSQASGKEGLVVDRFWSSGEQWAAIAPFMPTNQPGARWVEDPRELSRIVHVLRSGCRWRHCPAAYGPASTIYNRFNRWSHRGF